MANYIQIRRSNTSVSPANTLVSGELAYSYAANVLYVGAQTGISGTGFRIGGAQYIYLDRAAVGNLTANAAVIVDGNSFISNTYTSGLVISPSTSSPTLVINSVSDYNTSNTVLGALQGNNELVTANAIAHYVQTSILSGGVYANGAPSSGSNGAIQYNDQSSGFNTIAGAPNMIYDNVLGTLRVGNTSSYVKTGYITDLQATQENIGNQNNYIQATIQNANTGDEASSDWVAYNDDTSYDTFIDMGITSSTYANASSTITPASTGYIYTGNAALAIGTNATSSNVVIFTGGLMAANERMRFDSTGNVAIATTDTSLATFTVNGTATFTTGIYANGSTGSNGYVLHSNGSALYWDNPAAGAAGANTELTFNQDGYANGNPSLTFNVTSNTLTVNGTINTLAIAADGSYGNAGQALHSNGSAIYWANVSAVSGSNTYVQYNNGTDLSSDANLTFDYTIGKLKTVKFELTTSNTIIYDGNTSVIIGTGMDETNTNSDRVAIGTSAAAANQSYQAVAIGYYAGSNSQSERAVAVGYYAGANSQGIKAVAIGRSAGQDGQGQDSVAIGHRAGQTSQSPGGIALGRYAGQQNQGNYSIAIGYMSGVSNQSNNSIILNANGTQLDSTTSGFFVDPIRNQSTSSFLYYNPSTKEISYGSSVDVSVSNTFSVGNSTVNTFVNSTAITISNIYANGTINASSFTINGNLTANSLGLYMGPGSVINAVTINAASLGVSGDATITGNLTVQGTLTTIDTTQVAIADVNLKLASNNAADLIDFGFYGQYNVANTTYYSGLFRDHTLGDATHAVYHLYSTNTEPGMTSPYVVNQTGGYNLSTLLAYLDTGIAGGAGFAANATNVTITANSTVNVAIAANTLHLDSALPANSGGTGLSTYLAGDIIFASGSYSGGGESTTTLTTLSVPIAAANDQILMIKNNLPAYTDTIDGGTF